MEEIVINGKSYYTDDKKNGDIYEMIESGDIGDVIGEFKNGKEKFF